ncbi:hypothetical protein HDU67_005256 [Dinochytrium kinnereticum]|nr:hypothetical protein HDU67_005256 [Dinochytrium kinnereticum]
MKVISAPWRNRTSCCGWENVPGYWVTARNAQAIKCDQDLRVTEILLSNMDLVGVIPDLSPLDRLEKLDLSLNKFTGVTDFLVGNITSTLRFM